MESERTAEWISAARLAPFLKATNGNLDLASLVEREEWADRCLQPGAIEVCGVRDILRCLRPPGQPHRESGPRDQLTLGLA